LHAFAIVKESTVGPNNIDNQLNATVTVY